MIPATSILIASFRRPIALRRCLESLAVQTVPPHEVIVIYQDEDHETGLAARGYGDELSLPLRTVYSSQAGIVPAENAGLDAAAGEIILLIDDDAVAPPNWVERHLMFYNDTTIGAVGGPFRNFSPDGTPYNVRSHEPVGVITWYGKFIGNIYDHPMEWRGREPAECHHLAAGNMSFRRRAVRRFNANMRRYWQGFEVEACLQVKSSGFRVMCDFQNVIDHWPTNTAFNAGRAGNLDVKVFNPAFNHAFVLSAYSTGWRRAARLTYLLALGSANAPGLLALPLAVMRFGSPLRELTIMRRCFAAHVEGWKEGQTAKHNPNAVSPPCKIG